MADSFLLKEDGDFLLLETGDKLILEDIISVEEGAESGGRTTQKGVSIFDKDRSLGERLRKRAPAKSEAKLVVHVESKSKGSILIPIKAKSESIITPRLGKALSISKLVKLERFESRARIKILIKNESMGVIHPSAIMARTYHSIEKLTKLNKLSLLVELTKTIDSIYKEEEPKRFKTFDFEESPEHWQGVLTEQVDSKKISKLWKEMSQKDRKNLLTKMKLNPSLSVLSFDKLSDNVKKTFVDMDKTNLIDIVGLIGGAVLAGLFVNILDSPADEPISQIKEKPIDPVTPGKSTRKPSFNMPSSFVGKVTYDVESQGMRILLNGKPYNFCNVPERIFDSFQGANSKGAFFARNIKTQFNC